MPVSPLEPIRGCHTAPYRRSCFYWATRLEVLETEMAAVEPDLLEKLKRLPADRVAEVADFVDFLTAREERAAAARRLAQALAQLDAANAPAVSDQEIAEEVADARRQRSSGKR